MSEITATHREIYDLFLANVPIAEIAWKFNLSKIDAQSRVEEYKKYLEVDSQIVLQKEKDQHLSLLTYFIRDSVEDYTTCTDAWNETEKSSTLARDKYKTKATIIKNVLALVQERSKLLNLYSEDSIEKDAKKQELKSLQKAVYTKSELEKLEPEDIITILSNFSS